MVTRRKHSEEGYNLVPGYQSDWELHRQIRQKLNLFRQTKCKSHIKEISFNLVQGVLSQPQKVEKRKQQQEAASQNYQCSCI